MLPQQTFKHDHVKKIKLRTKLSNFTHSKNSHNICFNEREQIVLTFFYYQGFKLYLTNILPNLVTLYKAIKQTGVAQLLLSINSANS